MATRGPRVGPTPRRTTGPVRALPEPIRGYGKKKTAPPVRKAPNSGGGLPTYVGMAKGGAVKNGKVTKRK